MNKFEEIILMISGGLGLLIILYLIAAVLYKTVLSKMMVQREEGKK